MKAAGVRRAIATAVAAVVATAGCSVESPRTPSAAPGPLGTASPQGSATAGEDTGPPAAAPSVPQPTPSPSPPHAGRFDAERALGFATRLARAGPRPAGSEADRTARRVVHTALRAAGWSVVQRPVPLPQGGTSANLVATLPGTRVTDVPHVVIGAHLDTVAGSPGANDNATGVAVLVELAREIADEAAALTVPVVLVAFGAEEFQPATPRLHHLGSEQYAADHAEQVVAMLSIDMVGNGPATCVCWFDAGPPTLAEHLRQVAERSGIADVRVERRGDISDHGPFARRGIPAAFLWSFEDPALHRPTDIPDRLDVADLQRAGDLVLAWIRDPGWVVDGTGS